MPLPLAYRSLPAFLLLTTAACHSDGTLPSLLADGSATSPLDARSPRDATALDLSVFPDLLGPADLDQRCPLAAFTPWRFDLGTVPLGGRAWGYMELANTSMIDRTIYFDRRQVIGSFMTSLGDQVELKYGKSMQFWVSYQAVESGAHTATIPAWIDRECSITAELVATTP